MTGDFGLAGPTDGIDDKDLCPSCNNRVTPTRSHTCPQCGADLRKGLGL